MKRKGVMIGLALVALLLTAGPARTQDGEKEKQWTYQPVEGGMAFEEFIEILEKETDVSVVYDPASPQIRGRKIEIKGPVTIPRSEIFSWVRSVLSFQRMIFVPVGPREANSWQVCDLNAPQVTSHPEYVPEDELEEWEDKDGAYIVTVVSMKHIEDTSRARNALAQLATRQVGRINDVPQSRSFLIGDFAPVVVAQWRMLKVMDEEVAKVPPKERQRVQDARTRRPADTRSPIETKIESYERLLSASHTSHAAQYFVSRILELKSEQMEEREAAAKAAKAVKAKAAD